MATISTISVLCVSSGHVLQSYCHFDGYLEGVGKSLVTHWTNYSRAMSLVEGYGEIRALGKDFSDSEFYHRDRGEDLQSPSIYASLQDWLSDEVGKVGNDYIMINGVWHVLKDSKLYVVRDLLASKDNKMV